MLDQPALWLQALGLFVAHFSDWEEKWQSSLADRNDERRWVHALRSAAANIGAVRLMASATALEKHLQTPADLPDVVAETMRCRLLEDFRQARRMAAEVIERSVREARS